MNDFKQLFELEGFFATELRQALRSLDQVVGERRRFLLNSHRDFQYSI